MQNAWQRFVSLFGDDPEAAAVSLLVGAAAIGASVGVAAYSVTSGRYAIAVALALIFGGTACGCVRDYRRGRWSILSGVAVTMWLLLTLLAVAYGLFEAYAR